MKQRANPDLESPDVRRSGYIQLAGESTTPVSDLVKSDLVTTSSAVALIYHGYRRTGSVFWALVYGLAGKKVPVIAVPVAIAQGFGKRRGCE